MILKKLFGSVFALFFIMVSGAVAQSGKIESFECVVLLHGLARSHKSMSKLEEDLKQKGFYVINMPYPSTEKTIEVLSEETIGAAYKKCQEHNCEKIHFVTHSMGGILVRWYLEHNKLPNLGRVVMLSPPNHGSEVVDKLGDFILFQWINGPAGSQLGTDKNSVPNMLGAPYYDVGVITGDRTINLFLSLLIPGDDDGKVSLESAKLEGMQDFMVVHKSHPFIMKSDEVSKQVVFFIRNKKFLR